MAGVDQLTEASSGNSKLGAAIVTVLFFTLVFTTLIYGAVDSGAVTLLAFSTSLLLLLWAAHASVNGEFGFFTSSIYLPILGWLSLGLIQLLPLRNVDALTEVLGASASATLSLDQYATRFFVIRLAFYIVFLAAGLTFMNSERRTRRTAWSMIVFGSAIAFFGILQWLAKPDAIYGLRATPQAIPFGPFVNQHHFAALMEMTGGLTLGVLFGRGTKKDKQPLLVIAAVLMVLAIVLTGSRGGMISFLGVVSFAGLTSAAFRSNTPRHPDRERWSIPSRWLFPIGVTVIAILMIAGAVLLLGGEQSLLRGSGIENTQQDLTSGRKQFWLIALQIFANHPIIGTGFDTFGVAFTLFDPSNGILRVEQAHNEYLQTLADGGLIAFTCLAAFIYLLFTKGVSSIRQRKDPQQRSIAIGSLAGCFGVLIHSFFDFPLRTPANAFFFLMLTTLAIVEIGKGSRREATDQLSVR